MSASVQYVTSQPYLQQQPVHYAQASQPVTYGAPGPAPAYTLGSQMAPGWGASGVPTTSMYSMPQVAVPMGSVSVPHMTYAAAPAYSAAPAHSAAPAVFSVDPAIFAKLASGGQLTPSEMAQLTGKAPPAAPAASFSVPAPVQQFSLQSAPAMHIPMEPAVPTPVPVEPIVAAVTSAAASPAKVSSKKKTKDAADSSSKKASKKASSKKVKKGCCA
mmetsp:Transcript_82324/g.209232  ORF Transcript_82324/g.209232 Transcript_82324/m.209232 type:complete len:216 (+) Transcript_82324:71-718(+)